MKLYLWISGQWIEWIGASSLGELERDRAAFRSKGYCTAVVRP